MAKDRPIDAEAFKAFERKGWGEAAANYGEQLGRDTGQAIAPLLDAVGAGPGVRLLDVCCGTGALSAEAARRGAVPVGVDFAPEMVAQARRLHPGVDVREGDAEALPFADASFDAVACCFGIRHLPHPERLLAGASRVIAAGGRFAFTEWYPPGESRDSLFRIVRDAVRAHGDPAVVAPIPAPPHDFSDPDTSRRLVEAAGFVDWDCTDLPIVMAFERAEQVLELIRSGMARTRFVVESQPADARARIEGAILEGARRFAQGGEIAIPMPAVLVQARKPG